MRNQRAWMLGLIMLALASAGGCDDAQGIDQSQLRVGMDRSSIIARFGVPDSRRTHGQAERLTYLDGEHYQFLLMLIDGKLKNWQHDRVYEDSKFSLIHD